MGKNRSNDYVKIEGNAKALRSLGFGPQVPQFKQQKKTPKPTHHGRRGAGLPGTRIYVGGINDSVTREHLEDMFSKYGKTEHVWISPRGFAFVNFGTEQSATDAINALNGEDFMGCKLRVEVSRKKSAPASGGANAGAMSSPSASGGANAGAIRGGSGSSCDGVVARIPAPPTPTWNKPAFPPSSQFQQDLRREQHSYGNADPKVAMDEDVMPQPNQNPTIR